MQDLKKIAQERALRGKEAPVGRSFETEHQRAKKALVKQIESLDGSNIHLIAAASEDGGGNEQRVLRVAAYCRVSTDDLDQAISIALQIQEYKAKIKANPNWKYVGTYVDDGFSGTNTAHRQGFQKLMADAMDGKIDLIITKAVSRFARNLMDCIFSLYIQGLSILKIRRYLESRGVLSPTGKANWSNRTVETILTNKKYIGVSVIYKTFQEGYPKSKRVTNQGEHDIYELRDHHIPIIANEVFKKAQETRAARSNVETDADGNSRRKTTKYSSPKIDLSEK